MPELISLDNFVKYSELRIKSENVSLDSFVTTDSMLQNKGGITMARNLPPNGGGMTGYRQCNILLGNIRPYLKKIWFANKSGGCSADVLVLEVNKEHHPKYIYYALLQDDFFLHTMRGAKGTKMPRGDKRQILDFPIPNHSFEIQQKIGAILSAIDAKIELNNRINAELETMAKTLYDYWFVQFDFPDEDGKPYKASGGRMIWNKDLKKNVPEEWLGLPLSSITSCIQRGISPTYTDKSPISVLNQKCIRKHEIDFSKARLHNASQKFIKEERFIQNGDILVNSTGVGTLGRLAQVWGNPTAVTVDSHITLVRPNRNFVSPAFFGYSLISRESEIENLGEGSTGQTELSRYRLGAFEILCPNILLQKKFDEIVQAGAQKIVANQQETKELMQLRDWLLPMLMNGQVTVQ